MITLTIIALIIALALAVVSIFVPGRHLLAASVIITILYDLVARVPA